MPLRLLALFAAAAVPVTAQRMVVNDTGAAPVTVKSATVTTEVTGRIAVTTFDLVFRNPNSRVLEGTFEFPLLAGQSVVRFALDVNGSLREAVPVEKDRGRIVFEEIERRGVDPGLLEQTAGNNYRARIYPIPASGTRHVVIAYQEDVARAGDAVYRLALDFPDPLKEFRLNVAAETGAAMPPKATTTLPLELPAWHEARLLQVAKTNFSARGILELELPVAKRPNVLTQKRGDSEYFYAEMPVPAGQALPRPAPRVVGLLWDASGSGRDRDHKRERALLDAWFASVPEVEVRLIALRDHATASASFQIHRGNWQALRDALERIVYDGATSFDGVADDRAVNEWLLFSDGLINYGVTQSASDLPLHAPLHVVMASARADGARLTGLARRHSGEIVNLIETAPADAARRLRSKSLRVLQVERDPERLAQVFPEENTPIPAGLMVVTGMLKDRTAALRLRIGHDDSDAQVIEMRLTSGENPSELVARTWAVTKIASLETDFAANRDDIRRTSQEFGVVTANSSLIVLETVQDYIRYEIAPPGELRAAYDSQRQTTMEAQRKDREAQLDRVLHLFEQKARWWERDYAKNQPSEKELGQENGSSDSPTFAMPVTGTLSAPASARAMQSGRIAGDVGAAPDLSVRDRDSGAAREEVIRLSPFAVSAGQAQAYSAASTLAGSRLSAPSANAPSAAIAADSGPMPMAPASGQDSDEAAASDGGITLQRWEPGAGYLEHLRRAPKRERYPVYLEERAAHLRQPGFFLDAAGFFLQMKDTELGLRILSNLAELQLDDPALLRVLGHRLVEVGHPELARPIFEHVLALRPEEPQSRRDLALVCAAVKDYQRAVDLLWEVVERPWDPRFPEIELIALGELNGIVATCGQNLDLSHVDARLRRNLSVGLRVVLTWDADACDIDLWIDDPNGERAIYNHPLTRQGGRMSRDFTAGYGPEEFLLRHPKPGKYVVRINYFGDRRQTAMGPVTAQVRLITGFGTAAEKEQRITVRLVEKKESLEIGAIEIGGEQQ